MMRIATILCALALVAGCAHEGRGGGPSVHALLESYVEHAEKEVATRTHATGEHARHEAEMRNIENELKDRCTTDKGRKAVADHIDEHVNDLKNQVKEIESRRNSLRVVGRELTPEERDWIDKGSAEEIKERQTTIWTLEQLRTRVGLDK